MNRRDFLARAIGAALAGKAAGDAIAPPAKGLRASVPLNGPRSGLIMIDEAAPGGDHSVAVKVDASQIDDSLLESLKNQSPSIGFWEERP